MKSLLSMLILSLFVHAAIMAQCPAAATGTGGLRPPTENWACAEQGLAYQQEVTLEVPSTISAGGLSVTLEYIIIDSVLNRPCGINYSMDRTSQKYFGGETGCITFAGTTTESAGQYNLNVKVRAKVVGLAGELPYTLADVGYASGIRVFGSGIGCDVYDFGTAGLTASTNCSPVGQCPASPTGNAGLYPPPQNWACAEQWVPYQQQVTYENFDTINIGGANLVVEYVIFDTIENLPCGIGYSFDRTDQKYFAGETGCLTFSGTTTESAGQYNLDVHFRMKVVGVASELPYTFADLGVTTGIRVFGSGAGCDVFDFSTAGLTASANCSPVGQCPASPTGNAGLYPPPQNWACAEQSVPYQQQVTLEVPSSVSVSGAVVSIDYIIIDSVLNRPCGINYSMDRSSQKYFAGETGCFTFSGTTTESAGQYNLNVKIRAKVVGIASELPYTFADFLGATTGIRVFGSGIGCDVYDFGTAGLTASANCSPVGQCPASPTGNGGLYPPPQNWACAEQSVPYQQQVTLEVPSSVSVSGAVVSIDYIIIDSVLNRPCGINYSMDRSSQKYFAGETGCFTFSGTTTESAGQYNLEVKIRAKVVGIASELPYTFADFLGATTGIRVFASGTGCDVYDFGTAGLTASTSCSPPGQCPANATGTGGFKPPTENWACAGRGMAYQQQVTLEVPSSVSVGGSSVDVEYIIIDSIQNLPCNINYGMDRSSQKYFAGETGCITFAGATSNPEGQYNLTVHIKAKIVGIGSELPYTLADVGYLAAIRVRAPTSQTCQAYDAGATGLVATAQCPTPTGITQAANSDLNLQVYPNPSTGVYTLLLNNGEAASIQVYNLQGAQVLNQTLAVGTASGTVDISHQPAGMYLLHLSTNDKLIVKKLIKE